MAFGNVSANYLQWYRDQLPDRPEFDVLTALAAPVSPGAVGMRLRTNARLTNAEEVFDGMLADHTRGHAVRCIMEAVAHALGNQIAALSNGALPNTIRCAGGAARSDLWLQIKADMQDITTVATLRSEPTSLGAAILAEASLTEADVCEIARQWVQLEPPHPPNPQQHQRYQTLQSTQNNWH